jgi:type II secretory pathway pseudopilin PulG
MFFISSSHRKSTVYRTGRQPNHAFVLLMVLVAIIVVGVAMSATARRSLLASVSAIESQRAMQRYWGMRSCQQTVLTASSQLFELSDRSIRFGRGKRTAFPATIEDRVVLGGQTFDLLLADEDAKANLNAIYDIGGRRPCEQAISQLSGALESRTMNLLPTRPSAESVKRLQARSENESETEDGSAAAIPAMDDSPAFRSWGEVFDLVQVHRFAGDDRHLAKMTKQLTIHGVGRLNVLRAADETVLNVCKSVIEDGLAQRLLEKIRETSLNEIDLILEQTITNVTDRANLRTLLGVSSSSFSLWIEATSVNARQQRFVVQSPNEFGTIRTTEFSFE